MQHPFLQSFTCWLLEMLTCSADSPRVHGEAQSCCSALPPALTTFLDQPLTEVEIVVALHNLHNQKSGALLGCIPKLLGYVKLVPTDSNSQTQFQSP